MDAIEAMTVLRNRCILSVFAAVSYPRSTVISMMELSILGILEWPLDMGIYMYRVD